MNTLFANNKKLENSDFLSSRIVQNSHKMFTKHLELMKQEDRVRALVRLVCVKIAWSEHRAGSDGGDKYSLNTRQKSATYLYFLPQSCEKTKFIELTGENSLIPSISVFCSKSLACSSRQSVKNSLRSSANASFMKTLVRRKF